MIDCSVGSRGHRCTRSDVAILVLAALAIGGCTHARRPAASLPPVVVVPPAPMAMVPPTPEVRAVVDELGPGVRKYWRGRLRVAGVAYPPLELALLAFKHERRLEVWGRADGPWVHLDTMPILAASGVAGPKLRWGDRQVPEGLYRLVAFNPNSRFHLSMMIDYPNVDDLVVAAEYYRGDLGGDIFIHGGADSIGCLAIGDRAIEQLFVLVADVGLDRVQVILAPRDPRSGDALEAVPGLPFTEGLYRRIEAALLPFSIAGP